MRDREDLILACDMSLVCIGEPGRSLEESHPRARPRSSIEIPRRGGDLSLESDLAGMLGGDRGELRGELGPTGREAREDRSFFVEEVPGHCPLEVGNCLMD